MGKFKCPHCGHIQNRDGVCEGCDISKVLPIYNKPSFIKGVRYKCSSCNRRFKTYNEVCPVCGKGKLMPQYKNHKHLRKSYKLLKIVLTFIVLAIVIFGASFIIQSYFPDTGESIKIKASEVKSLISSYFSSFASQVGGISLTNEADNKQQQKSQPIPVTAQMLSIGDTATIGGLEFTIKQMVFSDCFGDMDGFGKKDDDYKYCVLYLDVNNPTNDTIEIRESEIEDNKAVCYYNATLLFDGEVNYNHSFGYDTDFFFGSAEVLPRAALTDKVISFKVPVSISASDLPLVFSLIDRNNDTASWKLR